jgi:GTP:adenosylcobinamide-phosphate guanylyltransferase
MAPPPPEGRAARRRFAAIVLAGDRGPGDAVARAAGVASKCLTPVGGTPMVLRVLDALGAAEAVAARSLCGPSRDVLERSPVLSERIAREGIAWIAPESTPSASARAAVEAQAPDQPVLVTTADHALLSPRIVDHFCAQALAQGGDVAVGVTRYDGVARAYPGSRRTVLRLGEGGYCTCNLFAFLTPAGRRAIAFWRSVEQERKRPLRLVAGVLGGVGVARYALGWLSLAEGAARASRRLGVRVSPVTLPFPEAAVDVDTPEDLRLVRALVGDPGG